MSPIRPFPTHVPTLTEVVEHPPIPESNEELVGAIVSDFEVEPPAAPQPPVVLTEPQPSIPVPAPAAEVDAAPALLHDVTVLTDEVPESEVLPPVDALLDATDLSDDGKVVAAAESSDLTPALSDALTDEITASLSSSLTPVLEQLANQLLRDLQTELNHRLRQMVAQAVANELNKRHSS